MVWALEIFIFLLICNCIPIASFWWIRPNKKFFNKLPKQNLFSIFKQQFFPRLYLSQFCRFPTILKLLIHWLMRRWESFIQKSGFFSSFKIQVGQTVRFAQVINTSYSWYKIYIYIYKRRNVFSKASSAFLCLCYRFCAKKSLHRTIN